MILHTKAISAVTHFLKRSTEFSTPDRGNPINKGNYLFLFSPITCIIYVYPYFKIVFLVNKLTFTLT